ncbi:MAG: hypothetical protein ABH952_05090 [Candidatus Omnitrophota bacterium]
MPSRIEHFFSKSKVQQFIVQFACRVPIRKTLNKGEKTALENVLRDLDSTNFQLFDEQLQNNPPYLFQVLHQLPVGAASITLPSFVFSNDSFSFIFPIKMSSNIISGIGSIDTSDMNLKIIDWVLKVQDIISNLHCQRAGKIFDLVLGPFNQEEKLQIFNELFSMKLTNIGELNLTFADYRTSGPDLFNIQTNIRYLQAKLDESFFINTRVDINNRQLFNSMEPPNIKKVWEFADSIIDEHFKNILIL